MLQITTFLTFDDKAEEAARFYTSIFPNSKINRITRYPDLGPQTPASLARNQEEAWKTLGRLRSINMDVKLPLLRELANYIHANRAVLEGIRTQRKKEKTKAEGTSRRP